MSDTVFFARNGRSRGNERKVIIRGATLLVSKAPTKEKRIKLRISDNLTAGKKAGMPDWVAAALAFVAENHDTVTPDVTLKGFNVEFSDDNLFAKPVQAVKATLRNFVINEQGEAEKKDVIISFLFYAPYSDKLWRWAGQMSAEDIWAKYEQIAEPEEDEEEGEEELELVGEDSEDTEDEIEDGDLAPDDEYDEVPAE